MLTGAGKGFCAGGDIAGMEQRMNAPAGEVGFNGWHRQQRVHHTQALLHTMPKPVIAAVNGAASGLGADTALACDFIIASEWASFAWSYIHRGIIPDGGGMYFLPRRVGLPKAKELIFTGRKVDVDEAVCARHRRPQDLGRDAGRRRAGLGRRARQGLGHGARADQDDPRTRASSSPPHEVFAQGSQAQGICYTSTEHRESVMAFLAKTAAPASKE